ncbi:MAG: GGDEF domain-containing protein [Anaerotignum sp.]
MIGNKGHVDTISTNLCEYLVLSPYAENMKEFLDLSTLNDRLKDKNIISIQFEDKDYSWKEASFIIGDLDERANLKHVIFAIKNIQEQKQKEHNLLYKSYIDEFTGLYNRKMYLDDIKELEKQPLSDDFVFMYMDINELKEANDTFGHAAGDELIKGIVSCMKRCIVPYGRVYRIGGDEFVAIIRVEKSKLIEIEMDFEQDLLSWKGNIIKQASVSLASVMKSEHMGLTFSEIEKLADKMMYEKKQEYYKNKGIDRRGENTAFTALKSVYTKILKVNLNDGTYDIIEILKSEKNEAKGFHNNIFHWLRNFGTSGQVHTDDLEEYLRQTTKAYICDCFKEEKSVISFSYRRKIDDEFKWSMMEIIPSKEYTFENQEVFFFVKSISR